MSIVSAPPVRAHSPLLTLSQACQLTNLSPNSIRALTDSGRVQTARTIGGHRRIVRTSLLAALGLHEPEKKGTGKVAIYARVSTSKQASANGGESDLSRQVEKLRAFCRERWGHNPDAEYIETGSGLRDDRKKFLALVRDIIDGTIGTVVVLYPDRLSRFGNNLFRAICDKMGVELLIVENLNKERTYEEELVTDLLAITHSYSCKHYARRGGEAVKVRFTSEAKERIADLHRQGYGSKHIAAALLAEGIVTPKGGQYREGVIRRYLEKLAAEPIEGDAIDAFIRECCLTGPGLKCWSDDLFNAYLAWTAQRGIEALPRRSFSNNIRQRGHQNYKSSQTRRRWKGICLAAKVSND